MKLVRNVSNYYIYRIFKFFNWSRLAELPSSDKIKMLYTEHNFYVDLENFCLKFYASERIEHK